MMLIDQKLKHYYVTGVLIEPGNFVDRFGRAVEFTSFDHFESDDVVPIYYEHGGPIVGFATRFYTTDGKLCFDGYVFDPHVMQVLMSSNPGVSAELIKTNNGWVITGIALTKHPAIENAGIYGVVAMSSLKKELQQFLEENGIDNAAKIAALVEKFLAQFKYPSPELKTYEIKLSEAAQTIEELNKQVAELSAQLEAKDKELEAKVAEINELQAKLQEMEAEMKRRELSQKAEVLESEIKQMAPNVELSALPEDLEQRIQFLESLKAILSKLNFSKPESKSKSETKSDETEKLEFSASDCSETVCGNWDAAISMYIKD